MSRYQPTADSLMRAVMPRVRDLDFRMRQEAMCVLTPSQRDEWVQWRQREALSVEEGNQMLDLVTKGQCPAEGTAKR